MDVEKTLGSDSILTYDLTKSMLLVARCWMVYIYTNNGSRGDGMRFQDSLVWFWFAASVVFVF